MNKTTTSFHEEEQGTSTDQATIPASISTSDHHQSITTSHKKSTTHNAESKYLFTAWSRVFFQARNDRGARQVLPTHCPTYTSTRDTYLYIAIDITGQYLYLFPENNDIHKSIIDDPPIELKYFQAIKMPHSHSCVALFSRIDEATYNASQQTYNKDIKSKFHHARADKKKKDKSSSNNNHANKHKQRYVFRFEFLNSTVTQPSQRMLQFQLSSRSIKRFQNPKLMKKMEKAVKINKLLGYTHQDEEAKRDYESKKNFEAHHYYMTLLDTLVNETNNVASTFVSIINDAAPIKTKSQGNEDNSNHHDNNLEFDLEHDSDDDEDDEKDGDVHNAGENHQDLSDYFDSDEDSVVQEDEPLQGTMARVFN